MGHDHSSRQRVAVIGSGVAGLTAAYLLQRRYEVQLFEADDRLGGHAHTHDIATEHGPVHRLDTGFLVHNQVTYPSLIKLFDELQVPTQDSEMSMSVRCAGCGLEYAGARGLAGLFAQPRSLIRPRFLQMLGQVKRFHRHAAAMLESGDATTTLDEFIRTHRFTGYFANHFLLPLVSAVWSCGFDGARNYPARYLFAFLHHHGMLTVTGSPQWRTVVGGSRTYVERAAKNLAAVHTATPVREVRRDPDGVEIRDDADQVHRVDRVVVATHPDQALAMLGDPSANERRLLGAFEYVDSTTVLHTDASLLPRAAGARASWNYLMDSCAADDRRVNVTYHLNRLQRIDSPIDYLVTLNTAGRVDPSTVLAEMTYAHPTYTTASVTAQAALPSLNVGRTAYAGAWHGWGFHEDGCASGVRAAASLGVEW